MEYLTGACLMGALSAAINKGRYADYSIYGAEDPLLAERVSRTVAAAIAEKFPQFAKVAGVTVPTESTDIQDVTGFCIQFNDRQGRTKEHIIRVLERASTLYAERYPDEDAAALVRQLRDLGYEVTATRDVVTEVKETVSL